jgi:hypothetical protein
MCCASGTGSAGGRFVLAIQPEVAFCSAGAQPTAAGAFSFSGAQLIFWLHSSHM